MNKKEKDALKSEAVAMLRRYIKQGDMVYTSLDHVSSNGMSRRIKVLVHTVFDGGEVRIWNCTKAVARACDYRYNDKHGAIVIGGSGMDMGFSIVFALSRTLFRDDFTCIGEKCPSNDHSNGDKVEDGQQHSDTGYALRHSWV